MQKEELRKLLNQPYSSENWKDVVENVFTSVSILQTPQDIPCDNDKVISFKQTGNVRLADGKNLAMFEVTVDDHIDLGRNRVELRKIVTPYIDQEHNHGVLVIYEQGKEDYRFTFTCKTTEYDEDEGDFVSQETDSKRYTYILGANESCKTAASRFYDLAEKKDNATIEDVQEAFSVEKLSKQFFKEYKAHYELFVAYLTEEPGYKTAIFKDDEKAIRDFVKLLLGRLVFIQFLQKKRWLGVPADEEGWTNGDANFIHKSFTVFREKDVFYSQFLEPLFYEALNKAHRPNDLFEVSGTKVPYLNGGLFEKEEINTSLLNFPETYFNGLFEFFDKYNFTIDENDPEEHQVGIAPDMLGSVFENLLEDNKDKGAFYTPNEIVHYMCQESLKEYLKTYLQENQLWPTDEAKAETLEKALQNFVVKKEGSGVIDFDEPLAIALRDVKICDPAIGSGAFPMGLLNEIHQCLYVLFSASEDKVGKVWQMDKWESYTVKKNIIQNSIYGVDIEKGAVDIARLRFWLSLIVDEPEPTALPNLDYKIVVGDSLLSKFNNHVIDIEWEVSGQLDTTTQAYILRRSNLLKEISQKQLEFFNPNTSNKAILTREIKDLKIDILLNQLEIRIAKEGIIDEPQAHNYTRKAAFVKAQQRYFQTIAWQEVIAELEVIKGTNKLFNHFDWKLDFPEVMNEQVTAKVGFNIVIGNPPYLRVQEITKIQPGNKRFYEEKFQVARVSYDLANLFFELAINISKERANNCYIFPHKFFNSSSTAVFRDYLLEGTYVDKIVHFGANMIFNDADTYTCITQFSPKKNTGFKIVKLDFGLNWRLELPKLKFNDVTYKQLKAASTLYGTNQWIFFNTQFSYETFEKIYYNAAKFEDVFEDIFQGIATSKDNLYFMKVDREDQDYLYGAILLDNESIKVETTYFKPLLKGKDVKRYCFLNTDIYVFFPYTLQNGEASNVELGDFRKNYPYTFKYLMKFEEEFKKRERGKARNMDYWYNYIYPKNLTKFEQPKLSSMEICAKHPNVTLNNEDFYHNTKVYSWVKKEKVEESYEYFLAIANSQLIWWFLKNTGDTLQGDARTFKTNYLNPFPLPKNVSPEINEAFTVRVQNILSEKRNNRSTRELENEIDSLVYKLYNLEYDEVLEIEPSYCSRMSEEEYEALKLE